MTTKLSKIGRVPDTATAPNHAPAAPGDSRPGARPARRRGKSRHPAQRLAGLKRRRTAGPRPA
jgi:hypothetical protein